MLTSLSRGQMRHAARSIGTRILRGRGVVLPPLAAFVAGWLLLAWRAPGGWSRAFKPATYSRRDSSHYLYIAHHGYVAVTHCVRVPAHTRLCGDVTWFPGYPALIRATTETGLSYRASGLVIAWVCWYLTLLMIWILTAPPAGRSDKKRWACLVLAAFFPGQVYFGAIFPISLCMVATLACVNWSTRTPRRWLATASGFIAGTTYPLAVALVPALGVSALLRRPRRARFASALGAVGTAAGVGAVAIYAQISTGHWNAYLITERQEYQVRARNPWETLDARYRQLWHPPPSALWLRVTAGQSVLTASLVALAIATVLTAGLRWAAAHRAHRARRPSHAGHTNHAAHTNQTDPLGPTDVALAVAAFVIWLLPYVGGGELSIYRAEACVIVLVPLLRRLPLWLLTVAVVAAFAIAYQMAPLFFANTLV